jgi:UDP-N-acetyl-2-amino-2-deoxyglucuronate dehydrogenase
MSGSLNSIRFGVMGYGHIGRRHAEMIRQCEGSVLSAVIDIREERAKDLTGATPFFCSIEEMVAANIEADVICIATPNGLHARHAMDALEYHKHVVIEKPMALKKCDSKAVFEKAEAVGCKVFVVMQNRYSPVVKWLKEMVASGRLGKLYMVQANCLWNRNAAYYCNSEWHGRKDLDGGTLFTQFSHFIDLVHWLFGDIRNISSKFWNYRHQDLVEIEDGGSVLFEFENGGSGNMNFSTAVWERNLESSLTIIAENGSIKVGGQYMDKIEYCHVKDYDLSATLAETEEQTEGHHHNHLRLIKDVSDVLRNNKKSFTDPCEAVKVVDIIERIYSAANFITQENKDLK